MEKPFDYKPQHDRKFYEEPDDDNYIHLVHSTRGDPKSIMEKGLLSGHNPNNPTNSDKRYGSSAGAENSFIWADSASSPHHRGTRVLLKLPRNKYRMEKLNDSEYGIYGDIEPEDIYGFDYQIPHRTSFNPPYISELASDFGNPDLWDPEDLARLRGDIRKGFEQGGYPYTFEDFMAMTPFLKWEDEASDLFGRKVPRDD